MDERKNYLDNFYNNDCAEETRLESKHGSVEFITTTTYIDKYLKSGDRILEVGAGTGKYSLHYANLGYKVNAIEFIDHNIEVFKSNIKDNMDVVVEQGDAIDLSRFEDNTFDVTLVLGPLYHLYTEEDVDKAIKEAIRVTKKDGIIVLSYLTNDSIMISYGLLKDHLIDKMNISWNENFKLVSVPNEIFRAFYVDELKDLMSKYDIKYLHNVATDGMAHFFKEKIDSLNDEEFNMWIRYHLSTCERLDLQGYSSHMIYVCRKN